MADDVVRASPEKRARTACDDSAASVAKLLAPSGVLRVGLNTANFLLVSKQEAEATSPAGVAPDIAAEIARRLGVEVSFVPHPAPNKLADAVDDDVWDIGLIGAEPARASKIAFTSAYVEIPSTYLVPAGSPIKQLDEVDRQGVRIASVKGSAFGLWLDANVKNAKLVNADTMDAAFELFQSGQVEALASIRQRLLQDAEKAPGSCILDGQFMAVQQAVGVPRRRGEEAAAFLGRCVETLKADGFVAGLLDKHGVARALKVAPAADTPSPASGATTAKMKIAILGCGAMGSVYAALLATGGNEVWAVDVWKEHVDTIRDRGLRVEGASGDRTVRVNATTDANDVGPSDLVIIATKASGVGAAAQQAAKLVKEDGVILTIQNGLGAGERIAEHIDTSRVMLGIASNFGAAMRGPGHAWHASMNLICIGEMKGGATDRLDRIVNVWSDAGFKVKGSPDIHRMIWEKLIINCAVSGPSALTGMAVGQLQDCPAAWDVALTCAREADAVARAAGIPLSFDDVDAYLLNFVKTVRAAKPSLLQDHEARRRSEIDAINGAVPVEAAKVGLTAPTNKTVANLVRARETFF